MRIHPLIIAAFVVAGVVPASAEQAALDPVAAMRTGRELFEKSCKLCHGLDRSLVLNRDAAGWAQIVKRMVAYGAPLSAEQRPLVARYLATRSVFAVKCGDCHEAARVVSDKPGPRDWKAITERMAGHLEKLQRQGSPAAGAAFSPAELEDIAAFLQVLLPN